MSLTREQMLAEMGITPLWRLRDAEPPMLPAQDEVAVSKPEVPPARREEQSLQSAAALETKTVKAAVQPASAERRETIARLDWNGLRDGVAACRACVLCEHRKQAVLGVGDVNPDWLFVGEGPGADEDVQGEPFVGQAGKLLDAMLASLGLRRGDKVYIGNAVKCRPPGNRTPEAAEMAACLPFLQRQIELLRPRIIVLLGRAAVHAVLASDKSLTALRGKVFDYQGIPVVVTYHPAYLLRNLPEKAKAWEDLLFARSTLRARQGTTAFAELPF